MRLILQPPRSTFLPIQGYSQQAQSHRNAIYWVVRAIWVRVFYLYPPQEKSISHFLLVQSDISDELNIFLSLLGLQGYQIFCHKYFLVVACESCVVFGNRFCVKRQFFLLCHRSCLSDFCGILEPLWGFWQHFRSKCSLWQLMNNSCSEIHYTLWVFCFGRMFLAHTITCLGVSENIDTQEYRDFIAFFMRYCIGSPKQYRFFY